MKQTEVFISQWDTQYIEQEVENQVTDFEKKGIETENQATEAEK